MRLALLSLVLCVCSQGQTFYVCTSGTMEDGRACNYNSLQAAVDAAGDGATIIARSGDTFQGVTIPRGRRNLTLKSSQIDMYPRGHRIVRNDPALAKIATIYSYEPSIQIGQDEWLVAPTATGGDNIITFNWYHRWTNGTPVTLTGGLYSPYYCSADAVAPYGATDCPTGSAGSFFIRGNVRMLKNHVVYFSSIAPLPAPLSADTPYYVVSVNSGTKTNFRISETPDGPPITLGGYEYTNILMMEYPLAPVRNNETLYVVGTGNGKQVQVSRTPGGPPITFTQGPPVIRVTELNAVHDLTVDGFEITTANSTIKPYFLVYAPNNLQRRETEASGIRVLRCWIHPPYTQTPMPNQGVLMGARDSEVGYSIIEDIWSNQNDTQAVLINSRGNIWIHDNELSATGEVIMSGGNFPSFYPEGTKNIRVERNYIRKPLSWFSGIVAKKTAPGTFRLVTRSREESCASHANDNILYNRCFWYEGSTEAGWTRFELKSDLDIAVPASASGVIYVYGDAGKINLRHNLPEAAGQLGCPSDPMLDCAYMAKPAFPVTSSRQTIVTVTNGVVTDGLWYENKPAGVKNAIESKRGDNWLIEGNVLDRQFYPIQASNTQDMLINFTNAVNDSNLAGPADATVSSSFSIIRNNILRNAPKGVVAVGRAWGTPEWSGAGRGIGNVFQNNLLINLGSSEWSNAEDASMFQMVANAEWRVIHNTALDTRWALSGSSPANNTIQFLSNVIVPMASDNPGAQQYKTPYPEIRDFNHSGMKGWSDNLTRWINGATSSFAGNYLFVRGNQSLPQGYIPAENRLSDALSTLTSMFSSWAERSTDDWSSSYIRRINPRLQSIIPSADRRVAGADIDEIEALTGANGADVEAGVPTFAERSAREITPGSSTAVISYLPTDSQCTIRVWDNPDYYGTPQVSTNDASQRDKEDNKIRVNLTGLRPGTDYYGKRWCGEFVDVFRFSTTTTTTASVIDLAAPAGVATCAVEYGNTATLGQTGPSVPVVGQNCSLSVPEQPGYWRHVYKDAAGSVTARGDLHVRAF